MTKHKTEKIDKKGWPLVMKVLGTIIELTRFAEMVEKPKIGKNYEYWPEGAICATGKPYHGCLRLGRENKLMICFSGGGVSVNEYTAARPQEVGGTGPMFYSKEAILGNLMLKLGICGRSRKNPFRDWTVLFVPYASGDFHCGTGDFPYINLAGKPAVLHHHGYTNYRLLLEKIKTLVPNPDKILVTGFSAGAFATALLTRDVASAFPKCQDVTACVDSALMHYDWQQVAREVWKTPEQISARLMSTEIVSDSLEALHQKRPDVKIMFCCSKRDSALSQLQRYFDDNSWLFDQKAGDVFEAHLREMMQRLQKSIPDLSVFIFDTPDKNHRDAGLTAHCIIASGAVFKTAVDGMTCAQWLKSGVDGKYSKLGLEMLK